MGDYNGNGVVDAADYTVWADTLGQVVTTPGEGADGNANGVVDQDDHAFWANRFGNVIEEEPLDPGNGSSVPEPGSLVLLVIGALLAGARRQW